jgi:hypothetical protein
MESPEKVQRFLSSAATGQVPELPSGLVKGLKLLLAVDRNLLAKLGEANARDIDDAMVEVARLALSLRSDNAVPFVVDELEAVAPELVGANAEDDGRR